MKMPGPDVQNLMLERWSTQVKCEPSPDAERRYGVRHGNLAPGPGRLSVIEEYTEKNEKGEVNGLGVA